ncbi:MAG: hypothetical protein F7C33_06020 [Desulfurococcales archaeon]|nr:hypothetical protein [Desulfurococcales archaeon]
MPAELAQVKVKLLGALQGQTGLREVIVEASDWREALSKLRESYPQLREVIDENGAPRPGYMVFVDGVDYRLADGREPREIAILPVIHGGEDVDVEKVDWGVIEEGAEIIARKAREDGFTPDVILGILRGGVIPARLVADRLGVGELAVMEVKLYKGKGIRGERPYLRQPPTLQLTQKKVLIVDDVSDTGLTLELAVEAVNLFMPSEVRTASIYIKPWTKFVPDYYAYTSDAWIVFPWERGEFERESSK